MRRQRSQQVGALEEAKIIRSAGYRQRGASRPEGPSPSHRRAWPGIQHPWRGRPEKSSASGRRAGEAGVEVVTETEPLGPQAAVKMLTGAALFRVSRDAGSLTSCVTVMSCGREAGAHRTRAKVSHSHPGADRVHATSKHPSVGAISVAHSRPPTILPRPPVKLPRFIGLVAVRRPNGPPARPSRSLPEPNPPAFSARCRRRPVLDLATLIPAQSSTVHASSSLASCLFPPHLVPTQPSLLVAMQIFYARLLSRKRWQTYACILAMHASFD